MAQHIDLTDQALVVNGRSIPLNQVLVAGVQTLESIPRSAVILILCLFTPILGMVVLTVLGDNPGAGIQTVRWVVGLLLLFGAPIAGALLSLIWHKPWGVTVEIADRGYTALSAADRTDAETLAQRINQAIER
jgi:ABC-type uncharacterized transport system permease subunit